MNSKQTDPVHEIDDPDAATSNPQPFKWKNWNILPFKETPCTNEIARNQPAWTAVVADTQTAGRGRHGRHWTSDAGGLWLSAVLPTPGGPERWAALPLAIGLAVIRTLAKLSVAARMRWPNDIIVADRKLAGLLLERYADDRVVAGIGLNLTNTPADTSPELAGIATRLCDLTPSLPSRDEFLISLLSHLHEIHQEMPSGGVESLVDELNCMWGDLPRPVELDVQGKLIAGNFMGVTNTGDLILLDDEGRKSVHNAAYVAILREKISSQINP
ncbi:MAG: biotin--[acetyl-CoA-carboxylase] ligase [Verrucomicrobiota bacterium]